MLVPTVCCSSYKLSYFYTMFDINAFIESQQNISRHKNTPISKKIKTCGIVDKKVTDKPRNDLLSEPKRERAPQFKDSDEDEECSQNENVSSDESYEPSESEEEEEDDMLPVIRNDVKKRNTKKSIDDGNKDFFHARIKEWKETNSKNRRRNEVTSDNEQDYHEINGGLKIPNEIWKKLFRYQKTGVKWLWELHQIESGGLLGDEMGLGKTVQIIAFLAGISLTKSGSWNGLGPTIIVAPATVIHQWVEHFHTWWPPIRVVILHNSGSHKGTPEELIRDIHNHHGVIITTYSGIVQHKSSFEARKWHYVILDEGHKIRNVDTQISKAVRKLRTPHRIVVTGSPMQNSLQELWSIFDFMSPGLLGTLRAFVDNFANPITQGGYANASRFQETTALSLATTLKNVITPYMLRRTKAEVVDHLKLPQKKEQVLFCNLTNEQKDVYQSFLVSGTVRSILDKDYSFGESYRAKILVAIMTLRKICNHPDLYLWEVDDEVPNEETLQQKQFGFWKRAGKMIVINSLLKIWKKQGHRALIFTQSRAMICILEMFLEQNDYKYLKMDGSVGIGSRQPLISLFNSDDSYLVFLATTRVGGLGVNLTGADRVIIYDPDWNPAIDGQAKERAWRIGQNREVTIYRLLSAGTVEEKIYQRQVFKHLLGNKVFIDPKQKNYLKTSSLQGLFSLEEPDKSGTTETTSIFRHTQVNIEKTKPPNEDSHILNGGVSFSKTKLDAMRRLAQKISKTIAPPPKETPKDPVCSRELYKRKLLPPPEPPEPPAVNVVNDEVTNADFSSVISEIDIVSKLTKAEPHDFLKVDNDKEIEEGELTEDVGVKNEQEETDNTQDVAIPSTSKVPDDKLNNNCEKDTKKHSKKRKKSLKLLDDEELMNDKEFQSNVQKVKRKKYKEKVDEINKDCDQYVLGKLFSKGVQSALQHDKVIGLAEREEACKLQTAAQKQALRALKNLKRSRLKEWRW